MKRAKILLGIVAAGLFLSGVTVFPALPELRWLAGVSSGLPALHVWLLTCIAGLEATGRDYPFLLYAGDWLAFAHIMLAVLFLGAMRDPVRNLWVVEFGLLCCAGIPVLAFTCGPLRGIPWFWSLVDCSFAVAAGIPLWMVYRLLKPIALDTKTYESKPLFPIKPIDLPPSGFCPTPPRTPPAFPGAAHGRRPR